MWWYIVTASATGTPLSSSETTARTVRVSVAGGRLGAPDNGQRRHRVPRGHRQPADDPRRLHARQVTDAFEQALVEGEATQAVGVGRARQRDGQCRYVGGIKAGIDGDQLAQR